MTIQEIRDRFLDVWKRHQEDYEAFMAQIANGLLHSASSLIAQEKADACGVLRARYEHFDRLAQALR